MSIGTARATDLPDAGSSLLMRGADTAMYRVKTGDRAHGYLAPRQDAYALAANDRRVVRPGTHLPVA